MKLFHVIFLLIFINPLAQADISCNPPADPENGKVSYLSLDFEAELYYECNPGFILKNNQRRICSDDGTWSGSEPICQEVECYPPIPPQHGKVHILEDKFSVGNVVIYTCDEGRTLVGSASSRCLDSGKWTFPTPRCVEPCFVPKVEHGKIGRYVGMLRRKFEELPEGSRTEDNKELYLRCEPSYEPFGNGGDEKKVTCSHGKWDEVPVCESVSCSAEDLVESQSIAPGDKKTVLNGELLNVRCREGYSPSGQQARCSKGQWNVTGKLCQENNCTIHEIDNGSFYERVRNKTMGRFPVYDYQRLLLGENRSPGSSVLVSCVEDYTFQGKLRRMVSVKCSKGKWHPDPVCQIPSCNVEDLVESQGIVPNFNKMILDGKHLYVRCREGYSKSGQQAHCSRGEWNVTGKLCEENTCIIHRIDNGLLSERVQLEGSNWFRYPFFEYRRLELGKTRNPGSSAFLICHIKHGFQGKQNGTVLVTCSKGEWKPDPVCLFRKTSKLFKTVNCSKFDESDFVIYYDKEQAVNSTAVFSCKDPRKQIDGTHRVTCLSNGQWSGGPPKCKTTCPALTETEGMSISYSNGLVEGSIAGFHCLLPRTRTGVSNTTCLPNGQWAHPAAQCVLSSCSLNQLFDVLPENAVPIMDNVNSDTLPYNFSLRLACNNNMIFIGENVAKCGHNGSWQVKMQCAIGCGFPKTGNSEIIIEPTKDVYRFGESVSLFCNPGYVLSSDVVRLVCLGFSWSETNVPECIKE